MIKRYNVRVWVEPEVCKYLFEFRVEADGRDEARELAERMAEVHILDKLSIYAPPGDVVEVEEGA